MTSAQALQNFWGRFTWTAYDVNTVPSEDLSPAMPRITYELAEAGFDEPIFLTASLWDRSYSWQTVSDKLNEIYNYIGMGGVVVPFDGGAFWILRGSPFGQRMSDEDDVIRRIVIQVQVEYLRNT